MIFVMMMKHTLSSLFRMESDGFGSIYLILIALLGLSAFFSGSEIALVSISPAKARSLVQQKKYGARAVEYLKNNPERLLITILICNNVVNILLPVLATVAFTRLFGDDILGLLTGILTVVLIIFGETLPKTLAMRYAEPIGLLAAPIIAFLTKILLPATWLLENIVKLFGGGKQIEKTFSDEELIALAEIGEEEGGLRSDERERIEGVLEFGETTAEEIMTPRTELDALPDNISLKEAVEFILQRTHSRIPVYHQTIDNVSSILTLKNILKAERNYPPETPISKLPSSPPLTVPMSMPLENVLKEMKWRKSHMAIVVDEHGGTAGIVTLEDLLEEVFGEIEDETDQEEPSIKALPDASYLVLGGTEISEIEEKTGFKLDGEEGDRIARLILDTLGRFPKRGESVHLSKNIYGVVEKMQGHKIHSVRLFSQKR